ncbi:DUF4124 domain-containing protein [Lysobacter sp. Root494]|uniref:DUF4124 domain-containing protein n=1 Tax=Lysobacter sp. Root494 TaxID=1736549 RepID=UPI001F20F09A|nr:DUF4124 domain-containing protein [Lysobacter sp. Root494]
MTLWPPAAQADVRRCVTASGQTIFTDRKCAEVDAVERLPRAEAPYGAALRRAGGCARTLQDLVFEMTSAIDGRDANRLAAVYHWPGTSAESGYRIWTRLDAIANRPLVDIVPVTPASRPSPEPTPDAGSTRNDASETARVDPPVDPELYPQTAIRRNPVALRVEQTLANGATPARTVFGLTHYFGCWWIRF